MYSDHFWLCLEGMAIALAGDTDDVLSQYEETWLKWSNARRAEIRAQLVTAVDALAQLETRFAAHE